MNSYKSSQVRDRLRPVFGWSPGRSCPGVGERRTSGLVTLVAAGTLLAGILSTSAQSYSIDWFKVAGGGGTSTGGGFAVSGTIGQPDAGQLSGGDYSLDGGFWGIIAPVQTPEGPSLSINSSGAFVTIKWPSSASGYLLEQSGTLRPADWSGYSGTIADNGTIRNINILPVGVLYFRLRHP